MGAPKTQTIGGGSATPVANSWNQFLQGQLYQAPGAQAVPQTLTGMSQPKPPFGNQGLQNWMQGVIGQQQPQPQQPQQPGPFQNALQGLMNPNVANQIAGNPWLSGMGNYNPSATLPNTPNLPQLNMPGQPNMPGAPTWINTNFNAPERVGARDIYGRVPTVSAATADPFSILSKVGSAKDLMSTFGITPTNIDTRGSSFNSGFTPGQLKDFSGDPSFQAIQQIAERQKMNDVANIRARYGMGGNTASSGASLAESQYLAEANPRMIAQLGELGRGIQGLDLQQQGINNQLQQGLAGLSVQDQLGRLGIGATANTSNTGNLLSFLQGTRGQDINSMGNILGQNLGNQQTSYGQNASNNLAALIQDAQNKINAGQINAGNTMGLNQLNLTQGMNMNDFANSLFGQQSNNALNLFGQNSSNALNAYTSQVNPLLQLFGQNSQNVLQNQGLANNWQNALLSGGLNLQDLGQQGIMSILNNMFGSYNQAAGIGTPQAQTVQTPSQLSQIAGLASTIAPFFIPGVGPVAGAMNFANQMPNLQLSPNFQPNFGIGNPGGMSVPPGTGGFNYRTG